MSGHEENSSGNSQIYEGNTMTTLARSRAYCFVLSLAFLLLVLFIGVLMLGTRDCSASSLSWTGENGFIGDGVQPLKGQVNDTFFFRILYRNEDGQVPDNVSLFLDHPITGWVNHSLEALGGSTNVENGVIYTAEYSLVEPGIYRYYYQAWSGNGSVRMPSSSGVYMYDPSVNTAPLVSGDVERHYGIESSTFRYIATFVDADNDPVDPKHCYVYIDGEPHPMIEFDSTDTDTIDGKEYYYDKTSLTPGVHEYYFSFRDSFGTTVESILSFFPKIYDGWPDLSVDSQNILFRQHPVTLNLSMDITINNLGRGSAVDTPVAVWLDDPDECLEEIDPLPDVGGNYTYIIPYLAKGQSYTYTWDTKIPYQETQKRFVYVTVDMDYSGETSPYSPFSGARVLGQDITESLEYSQSGTNNKAFNIFTYGPDVLIRKSEVYPCSVLMNQEINFVARVSNVGNDNVPWDRSLFVKFTLIPPYNGPEMSLGTYTIGGGLPMGESWDAEMDHRFSGPEEFTLGEWTLKLNVTINGTGGLEWNTENNVIDIPIDVVKISGIVKTPSFHPGVLSILVVLLLLSMAVSRVCPGRYKKF